MAKYRKAATVSFPIRPPAVVIELYRRVTSGLWFTSALYLLGGLLLAAAIVEAGPFLPEPLLKLLPASEPDTVRDVLQLLASSTLTVTTVTFSILMVVLTMTASNFSPRALAGYMRDRVNQNTLGVFLGGFAFAAMGILLMDLVSYQDRLLSLLLLTAMGIAFVDLCALIYFIHHTATAVQITNLVVRLHREADEALSQFLELADSELERPRAPAVLPSEPPGSVGARTAGYIDVLEHDRVFGLAVEHDLVVRVLRHAGDFTARGIALYEVWPAAKLTPELAEGFRNTYAVGPQRTAQGDPLFGMELLAEVAVRALSPAVNDPNTAVNCLDYLGDLLVRIAGSELPWQVLSDVDGVLRVVIKTPDFQDFLEQSVLGIAVAGAGHARVVLTLLGLLFDVRSVARDRERSDLINKTACSVAGLALQQLVLEQERQRVQEALERFDHIPVHQAGNAGAALPDQSKSVNNGTAVSGGRDASDATSPPDYVLRKSTDGISTDADYRKGSDWRR